MSAIAPASRRRFPRRYPVLGAVVVVLIIAGVAAGYSAPLNRNTFSGEIDRYGCPAGGSCDTPAQAAATRDLPTGYLISLTWSSGAGPVAFVVFSWTNGQVSNCDGHGLSGSCSFESGGNGEYVFNFSPDDRNFTYGGVNYSGSYLAPYL